MKAILAEGVIKSAAVNDVAKLHKLFGFACEGRHTLLTTSASELTEWLNSLDTPTKSAYSIALELSSRIASTLSQDTATVRIEQTSNSDWAMPEAKLSLDDALRLLSEPLGILLENANNDWHFLSRIIRDSEKRILEKAIEQRWVETLHGGGCDITQRIAERAATPAKRLRTFVLFDSDRRHPDELDPTWSPTSPEACQGFITERAIKEVELGGHWRLSRRYIESYLPRPELMIAAANSNAVDAFFRLNQHQKWYFNVKKGFRDDARPENAHRSKDLYQNLNTSDKSLLEGGLGKKVADQYRLSKTVEFEWDSEARQEARTSIPHLMRLL